MGGQAFFEEPWCEPLFDLLSDGEWHDYETVMNLIGSFVPDDLAFEKGEYYRAYHYLRRKEPVKPRQAGGDAATVRTGQRIVLARTIRLLVARRRIVVESVQQGPRRKSPTRLRMPVDHED